VHGTAALDIRYSAHSIWRAN